MSEISQARINDAAMVAHEATRHFTRAVVGVDSGDELQKPWGELPEEKRAAMLEGVAAIASGAAGLADSEQERFFETVATAALGLPQSGAAPADHVTFDQHNAVVEAMESTINELDAQLAKLRAESLTPPSATEPTESEGAQS